MEYKVRYASLSEEGDRSYNEDGTLELEQQGEYLFALADGLGGQGNGQIASETVLQSVGEFFVRRQERSEEEPFVQEAFRYAQQQLCEKKAGNAYGDMMTTLVLLYLGEQICWGHIGDSRSYYFKEGRLVSQTLDHSVPQVLVYANEITPEEIRYHPDRNRLLKAMGKVWERGDEFVLSEPVELEGKQVFLLCSDGFWEHIVEERMEFLLAQSESPENWLHLMEQEIQANGQGHNMDNYSAVAVWIDG